MRYHSMRPATLFLLFVLVVSPVVGQSNDDVYEPYEEDEFPQWLHDLRRAEVVLIGSFPITLLLSTLSYEGFRLVRSTVQRTPIGERSEFGSYSSTETNALFVAGVSLSGIVSLIDFIVELRTRSQEDAE